MTRQRPRTTPQPVRTGGFTLIEALIVMTVLAVGVIPVAVLQMRAQRDVMKSGQRSEATVLGQRCMEEVRSAGFANAVSDSGTSGPYQWTTRVTPAGVGLRSVTVSVNWPVSGRQETLRFSSLLSRR